MKSEAQNTWAGPLIGGIIGGLIVAFGNYLVTKREAEVKMIEVAVGILAAKPEDNIKPARTWAVDVLDHYSRDVRLTEAVKAALLNNPLPVRPTGFGTGAFGDGPFGGAVGEGPVGEGPIGPKPEQ